MLNIIVASHGPLAESLLASAKMVFGHLPHTFSLSLDEESDIEQFKQQFEQLIIERNAQADGLLVLCDLQGGTPYNVACYCSLNQPEKPIAVLSGVNLPLLLMSHEMVDRVDPHQAAQELVKEARHSIHYAQPLNDSATDDF